MQTMQIMQTSLSPRHITFLDFLSLLFIIIFILIILVHFQNLQIFHQGHLAVFNNVMEPKQHAQKSWGPDTKDGGQRGGPKRWKGSGPKPARHIPWPEVSSSVSTRSNHILTRLYPDLQAPHFPHRRSLEDDGHGQETYGRRNGQLACG